MNLSKEIIERFLDGRCTPEEAAAILDILRERPELLDVYLVKDEWDEINASNTVMPPDAQERTTKEVLKRTTGKLPATFSIKYKWMMAAACIAVLITAGFYLFQQRVSPQSNHEIAQSKEADSKAPLNKDTVIINTGKEKLTVALKDGSQILMSSQAEISYEPELTGTTREIHLKGEAYFKVAKDKRKPFIVYSHGITTTALGTSFTIRALENDQRVSVALHTGKVVIRQLMARNSSTKDIYLLPGDLLTVNTQTFATHVEKERPAVTTTAAIPLKKATVLDFDREPLARVFDKLTKEFDTAIQYEEATLSELSFTGKIQTDESLEKILQNIALLNNLTITRTSKGYSVNTGQ